MLHVSSAAVLAIAPAVLVAGGLFLWVDSRLDEWRAPAAHRKAHRAARRVRRTWRGLAQDLGLDLRVPADRGWRGALSTKATKPVIQVPRITSVRVDPWGITAEFKTIAGIGLAEFRHVATDLADSWRVLRVSVRQAEKGRVTVRAVVTEPLAAPQPAPAPADPVDLTAVEVGVDDDGGPFKTPVAYRNSLCVGVMGAGKSGFMRAMLIATAPAAHAGLLVHWVVDLKFGIEVSRVRGLVHEVATTPADAAAMIAWLRAVVDRRGPAMAAAGIATHVPTPDDPIYVLTIDEIAVLMEDKELRKLVLPDLIYIMRLGRGLGVSVIGLSQNPHKATLDLMRDLCAVRIGLRMTETEHLRMVYGTEAAERGAGNLTLPEFGAEGMAFVGTEGSRDLRKVRIYMVNDAQVAAVMRRYPPRPHRAGVALSSPAAPPRGPAGRDDSVVQLADRRSRKR